VREAIVTAAAVMFVIGAFTAPLGLVIGLLNGIEGCKYQRYIEYHPTYALGCELMRDRSEK
jgi:hypothetical protein